MGHELNINKCQISNVLIHNHNLQTIDILEDTPGDGSRYLLYLYLFVEYKDDQAECVVTGHGIGDYANV